LLNFFEQSIRGLGEAKDADHFLEAQKKALAVKQVPSENGATGRN
jgi:hypothetical protein